MTLWNGSFPFYPGANACFPFDTSWAVIVSIFLSMLATFIIILPGIRVLELPPRLRKVISLHYLSGNPVHQLNETISYNEHFAWSFDADYDHSYDEGLEKGLPSPILYVAEKFTSQSPCGVHRQYRISSHYASLTLWMAFCTWLISILLFSMPILPYGGYMLLLTAALMLFSLLFFFTARSTAKCPIRFGAAALKTDYGGSFWLTLATGELSAWRCAQRSTVKVRTQSQGKAWPRRALEGLSSDGVFHMPRDPLCLSGPAPHGPTHGQQLFPFLKVEFPMLQPCTSEKRSGSLSAAEGGDYIPFEAPLFQAKQTQLLKPFPIPGGLQTQPSWPFATFIDSFGTSHEGISFRSHQRHLELYIRP
uniref:Dual oxidase maturation factor 1 n=1 Tax=Amazona collaria TaxID=241587 RepID=A0A8B9FUE8_9PSIT